MTRRVAGALDWPETESFSFSSSCLWVVPTFECQRKPLFPTLIYDAILEILLREIIFSSDDSEIEIISESTSDEIC